MPAIGTAHPLARRRSQSNDIAAVVLSLLDEDPQITAIVTPQKAGIPGVLGAVQARGLRIPDDISIVGLIERSIAELTTPPLTAISFPSRDMGYEAAKILIAHLTGASTSAQQILLRPELCVRGSTGPVRTEAQSHSIGVERETMKPLGLGVLGLGEGRSIISAGVHSELWNVVCLCDTNEKLCKERCAEFGLSNYTTDYEAMLANPNVDVVGIYTPDHLHAEHTIRALGSRQARYLHKTVHR